MKLAIYTNSALPLVMGIDGIDSRGVSRTVDAVSVNRATRPQRSALAKR
jgi:hypothetical protein